MSQYKGLLHLGIRVIGGGIALLGVNFIAPFLHSYVVYTLGKPLDIRMCQTGEIIYHRKGKSFHPVTPFQFIVSSAYTIVGGGWTCIMPPLGLCCLPFTVLAVPGACIDYCLLPVYSITEKPVKRDPPSSFPSRGNPQITFF